MMKQRVGYTRPAFASLLSALMLVLVLCPQLVLGKTYPDPRGYVNDFANVIPADIAEKITAVAKELDQKTGSQIVVATFPDLGGEDIDGFSVKLFEQWTPGQAKRDNGILIVDGIAERKIRLEIGYGLESIITDGITGRIRRDEMTPLLKAGRRGEAYLIGVVELAKIIAKNENVTLATLSGAGMPKGREHSNKTTRFNWIFPFVILMIIILASRKRRNGGGFRGGGPFIGGMFLGGGGFGGGGFGGGGGGGGFGGFGGGMSGGGGSSGGY